MGFSGPITHVGEVKDGPKPQMGPARDKSLTVEIRTAAGQFLEMEIGQDAAVALVTKLTECLKARGCL
jgi:hypothetical protein